MEKRKIWSHFQIKPKYHNQIIGFPIIMYVIYQVIQICKEHLESVLITRTSKEKYPGECECLMVRGRDEKLQIIPLNLTIFFILKAVISFHFYLMFWRVACFYLLQKKRRTIYLAPKNKTCYLWRTLKTSNHLMLHLGISLASLKMHSRTGTEKILNCGFS